MVQCKSWFDAYNELRLKTSTLQPDGNQVVM